MPGVITTGSHPAASWPGVKRWWGVSYDEHEEQYTDLFDIETSEKKYEEIIETSNFGLMTVKPEGTPITYDSDSQGVTTRITNVTYATGYIVTYEEQRDGLYDVVSKRRAKKLAFSARQTVENVAANVYNRAFNASYLGADGVVMCSAAHPTLSGNQSNLLTTAAELSEASLEDLVIQTMDATDSRGNKISVKPVSLHIPTAKVFEANRIVNSTLQGHTANNAINAIKFLGIFPKGIKPNQYFTSTTAFFIRTNVEGMVFQWRERPDLSRDADGDTMNAKAKIIARFACRHFDHRSVFGTAGV